MICKYKAFKYRCLCECMFCDLVRGLDWVDYFGFWLCYSSSFIMTSFELFALFICSCFLLESWHFDQHNWQLPTTWNTIVSSLTKTRFLIIDWWTSFYEVHCRCSIFLQQVRCILKLFFHFWGCYHILDMGKTLFIHLSMVKFGHMHLTFSSYKILTNEMFCQNFILDSHEIVEGLMPLNRFTSWNKL